MDVRLLKQLQQQYGIEPPYAKFGMQPEDVELLVETVYDRLFVTNTNFSDLFKSLAPLDWYKALRENKTLNFSDHMTKVAYCVDSVLVNQTDSAPALHHPNGAAISVYEFLGLVRYAARSPTFKHLEEGDANKLKATPLWPLQNETWDKLTKVPGFGWASIFPLVVIGSTYDVQVKDPCDSLRQAKAAILSRDGMSPEELARIRTNPDHQRELLAYLVAVMHKKDFRM